MVGVSEISALFSSLKAAKDVAQAMVGLRDEAAFQAKAIELQSKILDAQSAAFAAEENRATLVDRVRDLEQQVIRMQSWESEKQRYELKELGNGTLAYAVKESVRGAEPPHWICSSCYQHAKKSVLQPETRNPGRIKTWVCHECDAVLIASGAAERSDRPLVVTRRPRG